MTEREKMLAGLPYEFGDPELLNQWNKAKDLIRSFNAASAGDIDTQKDILSKLLGGQGRDLWITAPFYADYGNNIYFGDNCLVNMNCTFLDDNEIVLGNHVLIAPNVQIYTSYHALKAVERYVLKGDGSFGSCITLTAPVHIGNRVWIGGGVIIMPGVTIGDDVVIGAGSVVTQDIPAGYIAYGTPCKAVRENN